MNVIRMVAVGIVAVGVASTGGCHRHSAPAAATVVTGNATGGGGDRCQDARLVGTPLTLQGDLTTAHDDSNARIDVTGYSWAGRDQFVAIDLAAGQTITLRLDDGGHFDGGLYIFRDCNNIPGTTVGGLDTNPTRPLVFAAPTAGRYIIAIDAWIANTGGPYTLTITPGAQPS
jgi:hypothetical protein